MSTSLAQSALLEQVSLSVTKKGLDHQQIEGQNLLRLIESAAPAFQDPSLGTRIDTQA